MTRPCMKDLPEELLEHILRQAKAIASENTFLNCLRTCRQWHRIGIGLYKGLGLAASVIIESDTRRYAIHEESIHFDAHLRTDFDLQPPSELFLSLLRNLTIHVRHQRIAIPFAPTPEGDLVRSLQTIIKGTKRLSTFSLKFSDGWDFPYLDVPAIPQSLIAKLVLALPDTIISLELDTCGIDVPPCAELITKNQEEHLCYQIRRILTRLRYLRLRVGHVCEALLAFGSDTQCCRHTDSCEYCITNEHVTCTLLRTWKMRSMTIWLPWGSNMKNNAFVQASEALLNPSLRNPTIILLVHQGDAKCRERQSILVPPQEVYSMFFWRPQSNVSVVLRNRLEYFNFKTVTGYTRMPSRSRAPFRRLVERFDNIGRRCFEHERLLLFHDRRFHISPSLGAGTASAYSYMGEQTVENMLSWTQNRHLGYRFPISESDEYGKPYWKAEKLWACRFPGCRERCETLVHLRGHHMYAHPKQPHDGNWEGYEPCPSVGCDRIGANGFKDSKEMEEHLLAHHLWPCRLIVEPRGGSL